MSSPIGTTSASVIYTMDVSGSITDEQEEIVRIRLDPAIWMGIFGLLGENRRNGTETGRTL
jgi:hypothetical protein